jgi:hypothetical protein
VIAPRPARMRMKIQNMVSKADFKNLFQYYLKDMLTTNEKQTKNKNSMDVDDESLDMNVFEKLMEGNHNEIVSNDDHDTMSIESTNNFVSFWTKQFD